MSRISIDVSAEEHKKLKALAALRGQSIKDFVIERTLGVDGDDHQDADLAELERLLDQRIRRAAKGTVSNQTVSSIFERAYLKAKPRKR